MKVRFISNIKHYTGCSEVSVDGCSSMDELIEKLCSMYGEQFKNIIYGGPDEDAGVVITVNGRHIAASGGFGTMLNEDDEISIFPVIIGG